VYGFGAKFCCDVNIFCLLVSAEAQVVAKTAQSHMYTALTAKRNVLVEELEAKVKRYKELQVKEMVRLQGVDHWERDLMLEKSHLKY